MSPVAVDFERLGSDLAASSKLGYEGGADDPNVAFELPADDEVRWLADWLVSEGWTRSPNWPREVNDAWLAVKTAHGERQISECRPFAIGHNGAVGRGRADGKEASPRVGPGRFA